MNLHYKVILIIFTFFKVSFEDEDVTHLQDPDTGEINKVGSAQIYRKMFKS